MSCGKLALIAGEGQLPFVILEGLERRGEVAPLIYILGDDWDSYSSRGYTAQRVENPLAFGVLLAKMRLKGVRRLMMAGRVPKRLMYRREQMDPEARSLLEGVKDRNDHNLLDGIVRIIEGFGISVVGYEDVVPEMLATEGAIAGPEPTENDMDDCNYGWPILRSILPFSFGQSIVVADRAVVAVEAMEGTDETVRRAGSIIRKGSLLKGIRSDQDRRFDLPVVGCFTLKGMSEAGLKALFVEAGSVLILGRPDFERTATELGIAVWGVKSCQSS